MVVTLSGSGPLYQQVYRAFRDAILTGRLRAGDRLPVSRALARDLGISRNVTLIAYEQLISEGYAVGRVGSGTFVSAAVPDTMLRAPDTLTRAGLTPQRPAQLSAYARRLLVEPPPTPADFTRRRYDFAYYRASAEDFPADLWRRMLARRLRTLPLDYSPVEGDLELRHELTLYLRRTRAVQCDPDQVLLVNGSQQALDLIARVLLDPGDTVAIEEPHYTGAREVFRSAGAHLLPLPVDAAGVDPSKLPRRSSTRVRLAYVTPSHQFPTGAILSLDRRLALLSWAEETGAYILEDDYDGEYRYESRPVEAVQSLDRTGRVVYTGTFSRVLFPSLRMGYIVMPRPLIPALSQAKYVADRHTSLVQQAALAEFLREGHLERCIRRAQVRNASRRDALLKALDRHFGDSVEVRGAAAGLHVLAHFREVRRSQVAAWLERAAAAEVYVYSAAPYYLTPPNRCELVLGYGAMPERDIAAGIRLLEAAWQSMRR
jgi:GntR family transcriptional regulator/MocR family aminotransferase